MLVDHQPVKADLVGQDVLVKIVVIVAGRYVPVEVGVRHLQAHRRVLQILAFLEHVVRQGTGERECSQLPCGRERTGAGRFASRRDA